MNHTWPFFHAQFQTAEYGSGADQVIPPKVPSTTIKELVVPDTLCSTPRSALTPPSTAKEAKRLSLQLHPARSFNKIDLAPGGSTVAQKGYRTFTPGTYIYGFELPIDSRLPETINVELGSVKYELEATVERAGAFRANLVGTREVTLIRAPTEGSLEQVEPIAIARDWEDQLHYDIVISGKSFPLGAKVPIAFKLTPLAKVQCHRIKVFLTENIQYFTADRRVQRPEPARKILLFEKRADGNSTSAYPGSTVRITAGGGISYNAREAAARGDENVPRDLSSLLGNLEGENNVGPTEMEFNVQLPSCSMMREKDKFQRIHFDTTYQNIQVHHWIKVRRIGVGVFCLLTTSSQIVMRLSKTDEVDPSKRRHFEISIDSPFHILSCQATLANTALPAYSAPDTANLMTEHYECGCPNALPRRNSPSSLLPTLSSIGSDLNTSSPTINVIQPSGERLTRPEAAHIHDDPNSRLVRPIHLLRSPSFNPPAFSDDEPPPPLMTPPPQYDSIVNGDPRGGLADYFARLADAVGDEDDDDDNSRLWMEHPLTPGGRINRSMDERRTWQRFSMQPTDGVYGR